ncbi:hypothetical protein IMZ11_02425 [Microtetraspora sp. AC03309]|uniref:hypothetical protein n=1 Tax=Microtetraspora sp. AC03309 TaxID=2779376 RepID=UPI001E4B93BB|nr:hypothetical protein [Microtetraspora sp. AC03309]MCC5574496.1 hypothetical protein [Microtetraspora sp. AC03309]
MDRAAALRAQADAVETLDRLERDLADAKAAHEDNPTPETYAAKQKVAHALRAAREAARSEGVTVGGDAYVDEEN